MNTVLYELLGHMRRQNTFVAPAVWSGYPLLLLSLCAGSSEEDRQGKALPRSDFGDLVNVFPP